MSIKAYYPENPNSVVRSILELPTKIYVIPEGKSSGETLANQNIIRSKLERAGFDLMIKCVESEESFSKGNGKYSVEVETGKNPKVAHSLCQVLGLVTRPVTGLKNLH